MPPRPTHIAQHLKATATNACGRLLRVDDGTGYQIFSYDKLGNVSENIRTFALPFEDSVYNFRMLYEYDSWNRVQRIVYPDSEVVTYNYDLGGQLCRVHTYKSGHRDTLIKNILYDEFGHRTQVNFGNGVTTNYNYDILQRLSLLETKKPSSPALQKISYSFDLEDNITKVENTAGGANGLGGAYVNTYNYDDLYRLTAANGSYSGNNTNYSLEMAYTPAGRLCGKIQDYTATANTYAYSPNAKPHAVRRYYNGLTNELYSLLWDANGNLAQQTVYSVNNNVPAYQNMRALYWDEDDRLNLVAGDGYLSYYAYGYDGNRAIKMTGNAAIDQSGTLLNSTNLENITIYPSEYLTVTQAEYTKYYYAGVNRIASKIGTGGFGKMTRLCTLDQSLSYNANLLFDNVIQQIVNPTNQANDEFPVDVCGGYSVNTELFTNQLPTLYISQTSLNFTQNNLLQQFRQNLTGGIEAVYYFHSDHLGSASWITNGTGAAVQHLLYLPFGEHFVNERNTAYDERFTFTGKERDAETGYYYHGARFNSSDIGWLSVDPMSDKYPSLTPYNYCAWNPVKLVDPEGNYFVGVDGENVEVTREKSGKLSVGDNASDDLKRMASMINSSGSKTAAKQFMKLSKNNCKVHFQIVKGDQYDYLGLHQAHNENGEPIAWDTEKNVFMELPSYADNTTYKEATITIYEDVVDNYKYQLDYQGKKPLTLENAMVAIFAHEAEHNMNKSDIISIKRAILRGIDNTRNVERCATRIEKRTLKEISHAQK